MTQNSKGLWQPPPRGVRKLAGKLNRCMKPGFSSRATAAWTWFPFKLRFTWEISVGKRFPGCLCKKLLGFHALSPLFRDALGAGRLARQALPPQLCQGTLPCVCCSPTPSPAGAMPCKAAGINVPPAWCLLQGLLGLDVQALQVV